MLKSSFIGLFIILICQNVYAQRKWKDQFYQELNHKNFRNFSLIYEELNPKKIDYKLINTAVFFVSNEARSERGLSIVEFDPNLEIMAWNHSTAMAKRDFFNHFNPKDKKRKNPDQRAKLAGIRNPSIGENISASGGRSFANYLELADHLVDEWIDSPPHRKTLYSEGAVQLGCGVYFYDGLWQKNKEVHRQGRGFW